MIEVRSVKDCFKIKDLNHRKIIKNYIRIIYLAYAGDSRDSLREYLKQANTERQGVIYFDKDDDMSKDIPHLNNSEFGLYCISNIWTDKEIEYGWCWEHVTWHKWCNIFSILVLMNDDFGMWYMFPDGDYLNLEFRNALMKACDIIVNKEEDEWFNADNKKV